MTMCATAKIDMRGVASSPQRKNHLARDDYDII